MKNSAQMSHDDQKGLLYDCNVIMNLQSLEVETSKAFTSLARHEGIIPNVPKSKPFWQAVFHSGSITSVLTHREKL